MLCVSKATTSPKRSLDAAVDPRWPFTIVRYQALALLPSSISFIDALALYLAPNSQELSLLVINL